jgi:hypothetical protein
MKGKPEVVRGASEPPQYELRFKSLFSAGHSYAFPCDACGHVDLDALSDVARENYLYARTVIGREYALPAVIPNEEH